MITLSHVTVSYGTVNALEDVSVTFETNHTYSVIGPSGCGKSTLLYVLAGLLQPSDGVKQDISILLQDYALLPWKTIWQNAAFVLKDRGIPAAEIDSRLQLLFSELDMIDFKHRYPRTLSGGQRQRAALIRALCTQPRLLLLDEPSAALDAFTRETMQSLIVSLHAKHPCTLVSVTHDMEEACQLGQHILIMQKAGIKQVVDNPYFGLANPRESADFFQFCTQMRRCISDASSRLG